MNKIVLFRTGQAAANFSTPSDSIAGVGRTFKYKQNQIRYSSLSRTVFPKVYQLQNTYSEKFYNGRTDERMDK